MGQKLILIRGLPGSGKSTLAKKLLKRGWKHYEADSYHIDSDGVYRFQISRAAEAHSLCINMTASALDTGKTVIVSNTFTTLQELQPYLSMAEEYKVPVEVLCCTGNFKSIHEVPDEILEKMRVRWQPFSGEHFIGDNMPVLCPCCKSDHVKYKCGNCGYTFTKWQ